MLNLEKINENLIKLFLNKSIYQVRDTFSSNHGYCFFINNKETQNIECFSIKKWRIKNIGAPFSYEFVADPKIRIDFKFYFCLQVVCKVETYVTDLTIYPKINTR